MVQKQLVLIGDIRRKGKNNEEFVIFRNFKLIFCFDEFDMIKLLELVSIPKERIKIPNLLDF